MIKKLSEKGTHHSEENGENQDALCHAQDRRYCVISLADGASACSEAKSGAEIASRAITQLLFKMGDRLMALNREQIADVVLSHILYELGKHAEDKSTDIGEYSSTVASVLIDKRTKRMLCFSLGDSLILSVGWGCCRVLAMPGDSTLGCCVTTTKSADRMVSVTMTDASKVESVVICSDGAWKQMFNKNKMKPEVLRMLTGNEYDELSDFLREQQCFDDYSFISMDLRQRIGGKTA